MGFDAQTQPLGRLVVRLLGEPSIEFDGKPWALKAPPRSFGVLAMLSLSNDRRSRASIAAAVWPELPDDEAAANLRRHLFALQAALPNLGDAKWIGKQGPGIFWNDDAPIWSDLRQFRATIDVPATRAQAIDLYRGPLLGKMGESILLAQRDQLRDACTNACLEEARLARRRLEFPVAIRYADRILEMNEWREDALRLAMTYRYESGDRSSALSVFERFALRLSEEMGVDPMPETLTLRDSILMNDAVSEAVGSAGDDAARAPELFGTPLVGRSEELATLESAWLEARRGKGKTLFVSGEAGIGKTRLLSEFGSSAALQGARVIVGETSSPESHPYEPFVDALRKGLSLVVESPVKEPWLSSLAELLPELRAAFPDLPEAEPLAADNARTRLLEAIARTIERLARVRPLLLVLQDLQWAGRATLDAVESVARRAGGAPALVVITYRPGECPPGSELHALRRRLLAEGRASSMDLQPLSAADVATLVASLSNGTHDASVAASIYETSEGNPLFVAQLLGSYADSGLLPARSAAPQTLAAAILSRLDTLEAPAKELLEVAAAIGRSFTIDLLAAVLGWSEGHAIDCMGALIDRRLIRMTGSGSAFAYAFAHEMIAKSVYETVPNERRAPYHRRIAALLATLYGEDPRMAGAIALHWERAGALDRAGPAYRRAAQAALDIYDRESAVGFAQRAASYAGDDRERFEALYVDARARSRWGVVSEWHDTVDQLERAASGLGETERYEAAMIRARYSGQISAFDAQRAAIATMLELAEATSNDAWRMAALDLLGNMHTALDEPSGAAEEFQQGLQLAQSTGDRQRAIYFRTCLVSLHCRHSEIAEARAGLEELRREPDALSAEVQLKLLLTEAALAFNVQDGPWCRRVGGECVELARRVGDMRSEAIGNASLALAGHLEHDVSAMRSNYLRATTLFERIGDRNSLGATYSNLGALEREIGHFERALHLYDIADAYVPATGTHGLCVLTQNRAEIALETCDLPAAAKLAAASLELSRKCRVPRLEVDALHTLGDVQVRSGEVEAGLANLYASLEMTADGVADRVRSDVLCTIVETLLAEGRVDAATPFATELGQRAMEDPTRDRFPTRSCWVLAEFDHARGLDTEESWLRRGRAFLEEALARFDLAEDREAFLSMPFNRALVLPDPIGAAEPAAHGGDAV